MTAIKTRSSVLVFIRLFPPPGNARVLMSSVLKSTVITPPVIDIPIAVFVVGITAPHAHVHQMDFPSRPQGQLGIGRVVR